MRPAGSRRRARRPHHVVASVDNVGANGAVLRDVRQVPQRASSVRDQSRVHVLRTGRHDELARNHVRGWQRHDDVDIAHVPSGSHGHGACLTSRGSPRVEDLRPSAVRRATGRHAIGQDDDQSLAGRHRVEPVAPVAIGEHLANAGRTHDRRPVHRHDEVGNRRPGGIGHAARDAPGSHEHGDKITSRLSRAEQDPALPFPTAIRRLGPLARLPPRGREAGRHGNDSLHALRQVARAPSTI